MPNFSFTFIVSGVDPHADNFEDRFFEAGCDDATLALINGAIAVCFDREDEDFTHAVVSAYGDVLKAGVSVDRFEPDYLVSQAEIAKRANLSRAAVSLYVSGERGAGFPLPHARVTSKSPLWDWVAVSAWLYRNDQLALTDVVTARVSRAINFFIQNPDAHLQTGDKQLLRAMENFGREPVLAI